MVRLNFFRSKTFLARLCEQAERYDGTHFIFSLSLVGMRDMMLTSLMYRNGHLHEG